MSLRFMTFLFLSTCLAGCGNQKRINQLLNIGDSLMQKGNMDAAFNAYSRSVALDPCCQPGLSTLGKISHNKMLYGVALKYYTKAIKCNPDILTNYTDRAYSYFEDGNENEAKKDAVFVLKSDSSNAEAFHVLGLIAAKRKELGAAMTFYNRAIKLDGKQPKYYASRASINYKRKNWPDCKRDIALALALDNKDPNLYADAARVDFRMNDPTEAMRMIQTSLDISPGDPVFLNVRAFILLSTNQLPKAKADIEKSMELSRYNAETHRNLGIYLYLVHDHEHSVKALEHAARLDPHLENVHYYLGISYLKIDRPDLACLQFKLSEKNDDQMVTQDLLRGCQ